MNQGLLLRQLNLELKTAVQMAYLSGLSGTASLKERLLKFAGDELGHFADVVGILEGLGFDASAWPFQLGLEKDPAKALIMLRANEDTLIHYYEEMLVGDSGLSGDFREKLRNNLKDEEGHLQEMSRLLEDIKGGAWHGRSDTDS